MHKKEKAGKGSRLIIYLKSYMMSTKINKFLEFNGRTIYYLDVNGTNWIAIKPICEVLGVEYDHQAEKIKQDPILSQLHGKHQLVAADNRVRKMICLPEKYIYGWIFSINSKSDNLVDYKQKCYEVLFDHFNGLITKRRQFMQERVDIDSKIEELRKDLKETDSKYQELESLLRKRKEINGEFKSLDVQLLKQPTLFE